MRSKQDFLELIAKNRRIVSGNFEIGADVIENISLYRRIKVYDERMAYVEALRAMLESPDDNVAQYAVRLCLSFVTLETLS